MSSKPSNPNLDNHYSMSQSLTSTIPLDNEVSSSKHGFQPNGLIEEQIYSVINNRDDCNNARNVIENFGEFDENNLSNGKDIIMTPKGGRKFSPDKIKGTLI